MPSRPMPCAGISSSWPPRSVSGVPRAHLTTRTVRSWPINNNWPPPCGDPAPETGANSSDLIVSADYRGWKPRGVYPGCRRLDYRDGRTGSGGAGAVDQCRRRNRDFDGRRGVARTRRTQRYVTRRRFGALFLCEIPENRGYRQVRNLWMIVGFFGTPAKKRIAGVRPRTARPRREA
jgi:hypothetical protein